MEAQDVGVACVWVFVLVVSIALFWIGGSYVVGACELQLAAVFGMVLRCMGPRSQ
jgi:hypothetical protein